MEMPRTESVGGERGDARAAAPAASPALAVVIPAWRGRHLAAALDSLRAQSDRRFRVYIGDDASPDDLGTLVREHGRGLDLVLHRFDQNLGGVDLVAQWHRCIALTQTEPWIWLFADDDEAAPECVAAFYAGLPAARRDGIHLLRFNHVVIDDGGAVIEVPEIHPERESAKELALAMLDPCSNRQWRAPDHLFSRQVYAQWNGFLQAPKGLWSDRGTWMVYAKGGGVLTLSAAMIRWRSHEGGTSTGHGARNWREFLEGLLKHVRWTRDYIVTEHPEIEAEVMRRARRYFAYRLHRQQPEPRWSWWFGLAKLGAELWPRTGALGCGLALLPGYGRRSVRQLPLLQTWARARISSPKP